MGLTQTIEEAREELKEKMMSEKGATCPCCSQYVRVYRRTITSSMAVGLIKLYLYDKANPDAFVHIAKYLESLPDMKNIPCLTGDFAKLEHWKLIEPMRGLRKDGSKRNGYYSITQRGRNFVDGMAVERAMYIYNGVVRERSVETCNIHDALKNQFDYSKLMGL